MPNITIKEFTFKRRDNKIIRLKYSYVIQCNTQECGSGDTISLSVALVGVDIDGGIFSFLDPNDNLGNKLNSHTFTCKPIRIDNPNNSFACASETITQEFDVAESILDEDDSENDEIRLILTAKNSLGNISTAESQVLIADFDT